MIGELTVRQQRAVEQARERQKMKMEAEMKRNGNIAKEKQFEKWKIKEAKRLEEITTEVTAATTASNRSKITPHQLYVQQERRSKAGAHSQGVAFGGYDLGKPGGSVGVRAQPAWTQGVRHHMT